MKNQTAISLTDLQGYIERITWANEENGYTS